MNIAYNMDCMEGMKQYPDKFFDLAVVDPPYGLGITHTAQVGSSKPFGSKGSSIRGVQKSIIRATFYPTFDDSSPPNEEYFRELFRVSKKQIIWGGNFFLDYLSSASCLLVWDKKRRGMSQFEFKWNGMLQENMKNKEQRIHATQKPVALYSWIYEKFTEPGMKILDTHLGSGSSRIAAYDAGLDFVGYEIGKTIFDLQEERFAKHISQTSLFIDFQEDLFEQDEIKEET